MEVFNMGVFPGTHIPTEASTNDRINSIVDSYLTPRMLRFREICIYDEKAMLLNDNITWKATFGNWLEGFNLKVRENGKPVAEGAGGFGFVDYVNGTLETGVVDIGPDNRPRDRVEITYQFDYFPIEVLEGFILMSLQNVNSSGFGPPTSFTIDNAPLYWDGVITDLAFAVAMERLILDYDLWKGKVIFALGPNDQYEGGGSDVVAQLETLKRNAEERAAKTLDNEKFKTGNYLAPPTSVYFDAIRGIGGSGRSGQFGGKLRGWKPNRFI
jgi:hypothetical protein